MIQKAVDLSLIAEVNQNFNPTNVTTQLKQYPSPPHTEDMMIGFLKIAFPLCILLSFIIIAPTVCQEVVLEKENKFKVQPLSYMANYCNIGVTNRTTCTDTCMYTSP